MSRLKSKLSFPGFPAVAEALRDVKLMFGVRPGYEFTKEDIEIASRFNVSAELERVRAVRKGLSDKNIAGECDGSTKGS